MTSGLVGQHQTNTFTTPIDGDQLAASVPLGNDNTVRSAANTHDSDESIHLQQSVLSNRPNTPSGNPLWYVTDTNRIYRYTGSTWAEVAYVKSTGDTMTGNLLFSADDTYEIGAATTTRPKKVHVSQRVVVHGSDGFKITLGENDGSSPSIFAASATVLKLLSDTVSIYEKAGVTKYWEFNTTALLPSSATQDLGSSGAPFQAGYITTVRANTVASVSGQNLALTGTGAVSIDFTTNSAIRWSLTSTGFVPAVDNAYDVGGASFTARTVYTGTSVWTPLVTNSANLILRSAAANTITLEPAGTPAWRAVAAGHLIAVTDNTFDIGATGATRPRNLYVAGAGTFGGSLTAVNAILSGHITTAAGNTSNPPINVGQGVAPTSPTNGDLWLTSSGLFARAGGVTFGPFASGVASVSGTAGKTPVFTSASAVGDSAIASDDGSTFTIAGALASNTQSFPNFTTVTNNGSGTVAITAANRFTTVSYTGGVAGTLTFAAPTLLSGRSQIFTIMIVDNGSGIGTVTFNAAYHLQGAFTPPGAGKMRSVTFAVSNAGSVYELSRNTADITP